MKSQDISCWSDNFKKEPQKIIHDAKKEMENLNIDFDDDIYWFTYTGLANLFANGAKEIMQLEYLPVSMDYSIQLWEIYRIHSSMKLTDAAYANFTGSIVYLATAKGDKWQRRRDLKVNLYIN